jgi:phosphatidylglycerol:prolipoprotein diacylglycerol transferase
MWQHWPEKLDPVAFSVGRVEVSWYGIMYIVAFAIVYFLVRYRIRNKETDISFEIVRDFFPWAILGLSAHGSAMFSFMTGRISKITEKFSAVDITTTGNTSHTECPSSAD